MSASRYEIEQNDTPNNGDDEDDHDDKGDDDEGDDERDEDDEGDEDNDGESESDQISVLFKNMDKCEELLKSVNIFRHLDLEQRRNIAGVMQFEEYKEGDIILHQGTAMVHLLSVKKNKFITTLSVTHFIDIFKYNQSLREIDITGCSLTKQDNQCLNNLSNQNKRFIIQSDAEENDCITS